MLYTTYQLGEMTVAAAQKYGIDPRIAVEQIRQESSFNPNATGPATRYGTAKGIAQFIDATARDYGLTNPYDPALALDAYGRYMRDLLRMFGGDYRKALAGYNAGPGNVRKYNGVPPFRETQNYVSSILSRAGRAAGGAVQTITDTAAHVANSTSRTVEQIIDDTSSSGAAALLLGLGILFLLVRARSS